MINNMNLLAEIKRKIVLMAKNSERRIASVTADNEAIILRFNALETYVTGASMLEGNRAAFTPAQRQQGLEDVRSKAASGTHWYYESAVDQEISLSIF